MGGEQRAWWTNHAYSAAVDVASTLAAITLGRASVSATVGGAAGVGVAVRGIIHRPVRVHLFAHSTGHPRYEMVHPILVKAISLPALQSITTKIKGVGCQVGDDVGDACNRREHWDVQCACVRGRCAVTIGQLGHNGFGGRGDVGRGGRQCEEMAGGARVEDSPILDGVHVQLDCTKQGCSGESILVGGGWATGG